MNFNYLDNVDQRFGVLFIPNSDTILRNKQWTQLNTILSWRLY